MPENTVVDCWKYQPLEGPRSIRLIEFSPSLLNPLEIQLRLKDVCLDEAPPYHALSYAWGPLTDKTITFHGAEGEKSLPVNDNCKEAIEAFEQAVARSNSVLSFTTDDDPTMPESQQEKSADIIHLWVDNICIDQADDAEADFHRQLLLMCEIYQNAKTTIVWLGQEEADAGYCLDAIKTAFPADQSTRILPIDESTLTSRSSETQKQSQNTQTKEEFAKFRSKGTRLYMAIDTLLRRRWFSRLWILQEVAVATKVNLLCGKKSISWESLSKLLTYINEGRGKTPAAVKRAMRIDSLRTQYQRSKAEGLPIWAALIIGRHQYCTKPVDRIWAITGISSDLRRSIPELGLDRGAMTLAEMKGYALRAALAPRYSAFSAYSIPISLAVGICIAGKSSWYLQHGQATLALSLFDLLGYQHWYVSFLSVYLVSLVRHAFRYWALFSFKKFTSGSYFRDLLGKCALLLDLFSLPGLIDAQERQFSMLHYIWLFANSFYQATVPRSTAPKVLAPTNTVYSSIIEEFADDLKSTTSTFLHCELLKNGWRPFIYGLTSLVRDVSYHLFFVITCFILVFFDSSVWSMGPHPPSMNAILFVINMLLVDYSHMHRDNKGTPFLRIIIYDLVALPLIGLLLDLVVQLFRLDCCPLAF